MQMGVVKVTPDMNAAQHSTDVAVHNRRSASLGDETAPTVPLFNVKEAESIETVKAKMKLKLGQEEPFIFPSSREGTPGFGEKVVNGHELSVSLPNLNDSDEGEQICTNGIGAVGGKKANEKNTRSSLSNIYDCKQSPVACTPDSSVNSTSCLLTRSPEPRSASSASDHSPNEKQKLLKQNCDEAQPNLIKPSNGRPSDLKFTMDGANKRLSAVLENIPLFYLPQTKQLISASPQHSMTSPDSIGNADFTPSDTEQDLNSIPLDSDLETDGNLSNCNSKSFDSESDTHHNHNNSSVIASPPSSICNREPAELDDSLQQLDSSHLARSRRLSSEAESVCSNAFSQDSDASSTCRSDRTVIHHSHLASLSQGKLDSRSLKSVDLDEVSLSKISLERDSPKNTLKTVGTIGSLHGADNSSFSSISSISTGTDFSISAASYSEDYIEIRSSLPDGDEGGFMEINLHGRNSYERSRTSSQDSGIDEKQCQGAKPKRRGLSGFFTR